MIFTENFSIFSLLKLIGDIQGAQNGENNANKSNSQNYKQAAPEAEKHNVMADVITRHEQAVGRIKSHGQKK